MDYTSRKSENKEAAECDKIEEGSQHNKSGKLLGGYQVFLSASFPYGARKEDVPAYDPGDLTDAVSVIVREILDNGGQILFGGHPSISRLVLMIARQLQGWSIGKSGDGEDIHIYQSRFFSDDIPEDTTDLDKEGLAKIHWTPKVVDGNWDESKRKSLEEMRKLMLRESKDRLIAGVFIGGMDGIAAEHSLFDEIVNSSHRSRVPRIPIYGPGGMACTLPIDERDRLSPELKEELISQRGSKDKSQLRCYPFLAYLIVKELGSIVKELGSIGKRKASSDEVWRRMRRESR